MFYSGAQPVHYPVGGNLMLCCVPVRCKIFTNTVLQLPALSVISMLCDPH